MNTNLISFVTEENAFYCNAINNMKIYLFLKQLRNHLKKENLFTFY